MYCLLNLSRTCWACYCHSCLHLWRNRGLLERSNKWSRLKEPRTWEMEFQTQAVWLPKLDSHLTTKLIQCFVSPRHLWLDKRQKHKLLFFLCVNTVEVFLDVWKFSAYSTHHDQNLSEPHRLLFVYSGVGCILGSLKILLSYYQCGG